MKYLNLGNYQWPSHLPHPLLCYPWVEHGGGGGEENLRLAVLSVALVSCHLAQSKKCFPYKHKDSGSTPQNFLLILVLVNWRQAAPGAH